MRLWEHYVALSRRWPGAQAQAEEASLAELSESLHCSKRNVNLILRKLTEHGWIRWTPGNGRGNRSMIKLERAPDELMLTLASELVANGSVAEGLRLLHDCGLEPTHGKIRQWLSDNFGYARRNGEAEGPEDTLTFPYFRPLLPLDPLLAERQTERHLVEHLFDNLVRYDASAERFIPHAAHDWEASEDGCRWSFYLRKGILFHDGTPMRASDAAFTVKRLSEPGSPVHWALKDLAEAEAVSGLELRLVFRKPNVMVLSLLSSSHAAIIPREYYLASPESFGKRPIGSGPFRLTRNDDQKIELVAFPGYFGYRPHLDRIDMWVLPSFFASRQASDGYASDIDLYPFLPQAISSQGALRTKEQPASVYRYLSFNVRRSGPLSSPAFREALHRLTPRTALVTELGENRGRPAYSFSGLCRETGDSSSSEEEGKRLLAESGYEGEELALYTYAFQLNEEEAKWLSAWWLRYGIRVTVHTVPIERLLACAEEADLVLTYSVHEAEKDYSLWHTFASARSLLHRQLSLEQRKRAGSVLDAMLAEPRRDVRRDAFQALVRELETVHPYMVLYEVRHRVAYRRELRGVRFSDMGLVSFHDLWLAPSEQ
ncbi:ABC transporter substrate-binding protein [Paenibacillus sp. TRM 82003]|nr:ABC transporter substrate-binding protein [Paenibacillus sp. TRM 82003]